MHARCVLLHKLVISNMRALKMRAELAVTVAAEKVHFRTSKIIRALRTNLLVELATRAEKSRWLEKIYLTKYNNFTKGANFTVTIAKLLHKQF